jgi:FkbM family methyltransferase
MLNRISLKAKRTAKRLRLKVRSTRHMLFGEPFASHPEKSLYRHIQRAPEDQGEHPVVVFHPRILGGHPVLCRSGTRDKTSLEDLLFYQTYLPPVPLNNPQVIVDLGANVGYTVSHFAFLYPGARTIGLELDEDNFLIAQQNTQWCRDRVTLINAAIWSSDGYVNYDGRGEDAYHVVAFIPNGNMTAAPTNRRARAMTMESLIAEFGITRIDYLKMDIEGGEAELILSGNPTWLDCVDAMKVELHHVEYGEFERTLKARGFYCYPDRLHPACIVAVAHRTFERCFSHPGTGDSAEGARPPAEVLSQFSGKDQGA